MHAHMFMNEYTLLLLGSPSVPQGCLSVQSCGKKIAGL